MKIREAYKAEIKYLWKKYSIPLICSTVAVTIVMLLFAATVSAKKDQDTWCAAVKACMIKDYCNLTPRDVYYINMGRCDD